MYGTFILDILSVLHNRSIGSMNSIMVVLYLTTVTEKTKFLVDKSRLVADDTDRDDTFSRCGTRISEVIPVLGLFVQETFEKPIVVIELSLDPRLLQRKILFADEKNIP